MNGMKVVDLTIAMHNYWELLVSELNGWHRVYLVVANYCSSQIHEL